MNARITACPSARQRGMALLMVIMTLSALLLIGVPFFISMIGFGKSGDASRQSEISETGSYGSIQWAIDSLSQSDSIKDYESVTHYGRTEGAGVILDQNDIPIKLTDRNPLHSGVRLQDETGRIDVNSLTLQLAANLISGSIPSQACYKMLLCPIRPAGDQDWVAAPEAPRDSYRPFRTVSGIREIANIVNIDRDPPVPPGSGYVNRNVYLNIKDCLRVDYERIKSARWLRGALLLKTCAPNDTQINTVFSPHLNKGTLVYIKDRDTGAYEYNFCLNVAYTADNIEKNQMTVTLLFGLRQSYSGEMTYISIPERIPVNINTSSYKTLKAILWKIQGKLDGSVFAVTEEEAGLIAADIVARRETGPFSPDRFIEYDIADLIDHLSSMDTAQKKSQLIKLHAFNPYDSRLAVSTVGFQFASDRTFRVSGISSIVNTHSNLLTFRGTKEVVVNVYPDKQGEESVWGTATQYGLLKDVMFRAGGLSTGPNPLQVFDLGTVALGDFGTVDGIQNFEKDDTGAVSYVTLAPLKLWWNRGYNEQTSFVLHADSGTKNTILNGDKGLGSFSTGDQVNKGTAGVFGFGSADALKNDLTPEGIALGTDDGEADYLEYEIQSGAASKIERDGAFSSLVYEGFSFECWLKTPGTWDNAHRYYLFDIQRTDAEEADITTREYQNRVSLLYDGTESELLIRIADTSIKQQFAELRQKASFAPGKWYHIKGIVRGGGKPGTANISTDYKCALFIDGKPCWKLDPAHADDMICHPKLGPGADLDQLLNAGDTIIQVDSADAFPAAGGVVQIGRERIEYKQRAGNSLQQCVRGCRGTGTDPDPVVTGDGESHPAGSRVVLFGYSCSLVDEPLMTGGGLLTDSLEKDPEMPEITVTPEDNNAPLNEADFIFEETDTPITLPPSYNLNDFPDRGYLEIESGPNNAIVYYTKAGNTLTLVWSDITTTDEDAAGNLEFPADRVMPGADDIIFTVISIRVDAYANYPDASAFDGQKGYIQIEDEWFQYGRDECQEGKFEHSGEYYFIGTRSPSMRASAGMGGTDEKHDPGEKVIPVFRVNDNNMAPIMSNTIDDIDEKVTIVDVNNGDVSIEDSKTEMVINVAGRSGGRNWVAFTDNVTNQYNIEVGTRILKFPSGEMPAKLSSTIVIGNARNGTEPLDGEVDEILLHRSGYRTAYILTIDGGPEISEGESITSASPRFIDITRTWTGANKDNNDNFKRTGFLRINNEIFAYIFDSALTAPNRYKLKLIKRACFTSRKNIHRRLDTVLLLEGIPCTTILAGEPMTADSSRVYAESTKGFPPSGFLRVDDEIIGYSIKGVNSLTQEFFGMEIKPDATAPIGFWRGRFGSEGAVHNEYAVVSLFPARYPDRTPLRFDAGGAVTHRWDPANGIYFRKVITRDNTVFGLADTDASTNKGADITVKASVIDENGNRTPLPQNIRVRLLAGAGRNIDWTQDPPGTPADFTADIQEFIIGPGEGGAAAKTFDFKARKTNRLEIRAFFEYLPNAWQADKDSAILDPSATGILSWKVCPVIEEITVRVRGRNAVYETLQF
ncbi:hypothetical protein ACFL6F_02395 [Planctomycetota bacterium]